jgi:hypothetical protein
MKCLGIKIVEVIWLHHNMLFIMNNFYDLTLE